MTARALILTSCAVVVMSASFADAADSLDPGARIVRAERWLKTTLAHRPGAKDDPSIEVSLWSNAELRLLLVDEQVLVRSIRNTAIKIPARVTDDRTIPPYTAWQITRLQELAVEYHQYNDDDALVIRGAVLHGDVALSNPSPVLSADPPNPDETRIKVEVGDGESVGLSGVPIHWEIARTLFDMLKGTGRADVARRWYIVTSLWMQSTQQHDTYHLSHARQLFPDDVELLFLSGCQQEAYASPPIQAAARTAVLPQGYKVDVASEADALRNAEGFFRRVLTLDPQHQEARIHLGHVLLARGKAQDAADELRRVDLPASERERRYYRDMFLGAALEDVGRFEEAHEAYARAAALVPSAQSPYMSMSELAVRRGDRAGALREIQRVFELSSLRADGDPWWSYRVDHARSVDAQFDAFNGSIGGAHK